MTNVPVVLYHYDASPYATKVKNLLLIKGIPHKRVATGMTLPRPELSDLLGVKYRRIPVLAIGNDVYCDTNLIADVLERRFPPSEGYASLFPPRVGGGKADTGFVKAAAKYWTDAAIFPIIADSLPWSRMDPKLVADRSTMRGAPIDTKAVEALQGVRSSKLASHLNFLEQQLADGREWLLDTESIGLVDIAAHFHLTWARAFKSLKEVLDAQAFPKTFAWLGRVSAHVDGLQKKNAATFEKLSGDEAAKVICSSPHEDENKLGFDAADGKRLGVKPGDIVHVQPTDDAKIPTAGRLVALNLTESVIETKGSAGTVRCHFPRLEFSIKPAQESAKL